MPSKGEVRWELLLLLLLGVLLLWRLEGLEAGEGTRGYIHTLRIHKVGVRTIMHKTDKCISARPQRARTSPAGAADGTCQAEEQEKQPDAKLQLQSVKSKKGGARWRRGAAQDKAQPSSERETHTLVTNRAAKRRQISKRPNGEML